MTQPARYRPAIDLLKELGITEPGEIDIEAIAQHCDATVTYGTLSGSEARIVGADESAIITVNRSGSRGRERFSAAHELAHWLRDAGEVALLCNPHRAFDESGGVNRESRANDYAADLLMPRFMFSPRSEGKVDDARQVPQNWQRCSRRASRRPRSVSFSSGRFPP